MQTCSDPINREKRFIQLKNNLLDRGYSRALVESAIEKAKKVPREIALKKVYRKKKQKKGPIFAVTYDPRLPALGSLQAKHWRTMVSKNKHLAEVFKRPPLTAYRRQPNLKKLINKSQSTISKRQPKGLKGHEEMWQWVRSMPIHKRSKECKNQQEKLDNK